MKYFWNSFPIILSFLLFRSTFIDVLAVPTQNLCRPDERDALLQFKDGFQQYEYCSFSGRDTRRKITYSWDMNGDCCSWGGVTCDDKLGHVIELDLSFTCLFGDINSSSSLFRLPNLVSLNLAYNYFYPSLIPTQFSKLKGLTRLNLSDCSFSGQIPMELLHLTKLESLDLSSNYLPAEKSFLGKLVHNLTNLRDLNLRYTNISSEIPQSISNLSSLRSLNLDECNLIGEIPSNLFLIPTLQSISLQYNDDMIGSLPDFGTNNSLVSLVLSGISGNIPNSIRNLKHLTTLILKDCNFGRSIPSSLGNLSHLTYLDLSSNNLVGQIPSSIRSLSHLTFLDLSDNNFIDKIPSSIKNLSHLRGFDLSSNNFVGEIPSLLGNLSHLTYLDLSFNKLVGEIPFSLGNLSNLTWLNLFENNFIGEIPSSLGNLSNLTWINLSENNFVGEIPSSLGNLSHLTELFLFSNNFIGEIPSSLGNLSNLTCLDLSKNNFVGSFPRFISKLVKLESLFIYDFNTQLRPIDFGIFSKLTSLQHLHLSNLNTTTIDLNAILSPLKSLRQLILSGNHVSTANISSTSNFPFQLGLLHLSSSGITQFPTFIKTLQHLYQLDLSNNKMKDRVPGWLWGLPNLLYVYLSHNNFSGFDRFTNYSSRPLIRVLDLRSNNFQGPLFVPPRPIDYLFASKNNFSGEIPRSICAMSSLEVLDLSNNNFNGSLPQCLSNLIKRSLSVLKIDNNHLSGRLPEIFINCGDLRSLNFGHNQLEGKLPRSLIGCSSLEVLNVEHNKLKDVFPLWLISLQELQVLVLRSNQFHGSLQYHPPVIASCFPQLRVIDVSRNAFTGVLPYDYFIYWSAMFSEGDLSELKYIGDNGSYYQDSMVLMNKGIEREFVRILKTYTSLDFSGNQFEGEIPRSIGLLKGLHVLSLSNNAFTGHIPSSMANLTTLESLDVSQNQLSGGIPQELGTLSFLSYMNFSHNQLVGLVPAGQQFQTQNCSSFQDNPRLYGHVLDEVCKDFHKKTTQHSETPEVEEDAEEVLSWKAAAIGFGPGVVFGVMIGCILFSYKPEWFMKMFNQNKRRSRGSRTQSLASTS